MKVLPNQAVFFLSGDGADLRDKLAWALSNQAEIINLAGSALSWTSEHFAWPRIVQAYEQLYEQIVTDNKKQIGADRQVARKA